jgi:hypothetical protein
MAEVSIIETAETPFGSIEGSYEYLALLTEAIQEAQREIDSQIAVAADERHLKALQIVAYNLGKLLTHTTVSRRILNDLRTLRRLLLRE